MKLRNGLKYLPFLLMVALTVWRHATAEAQVTQSGSRDNALVHLSRGEARTFSGAFTALAAQARVAVVAEGVPLRATLDEKQLEGVPAEAPLEEMVERLASAYDYEVERKRSVFLLKKRYTDPNDLPAVTMEEARLALRDVLLVLSRHQPKASQSRLMGDLAASLTPNQMQRMRGNREGTGIGSPFPLSQALPVAALSARQRALVWGYVTYFYVRRNGDSPEAIAGELDALLKDGAIFGWPSQYGGRVFGYETPNRSEGAPVGDMRFWPLSNPHRISSGMLIKKSGGRHRIMGFRMPSPNEPEDRTPDPTTPIPLDAAAAADPTAREAAAAPSTLESVITGLNARPDKNAARMGVDDALAAKPVTVFSAESAAPGQILDALAAVYDLRVKAQEDGALLLTRRLYKMAPLITDLPDALRHVYPEPLLRAFHADERDRLMAEARERTLRSQQGQDKIEPPANVAEYTAAQQRLEMERYKRWRQLNGPPDTFRIAAMQRLRALIEPKAKAAPGGRVPLSALGDEEHRALTALLMAETWQHMSEVFRHPAPEWITDFDRLLLVGGLIEHEGKQFFSLSLAMPLPDGKQAGVIGPSSTTGMRNPK